MIRSGRRGFVSHMSGSSKNPDSARHAKEHIFEDSLSQDFKQKLCVNESSRPGVGVTRRDKIRTP